MKRIGEIGQDRFDELVDNESYRVVISPKSEFDVDLYYTGDQRFYVEFVDGDTYYMFRADAGTKAHADRKIEFEWQHIQDWYIKVVQIVSVEI